MEIFSWMNGLSALAVFVSCIFAGTYLLVRYVRERKKLQPYAAAMIYSVAFFYFGTVVTFFSLVFTGSNVPSETYFFLNYTHMPLGVMVSMYLGFEIFNPEKKKRALIIYALIGVGYYIAMFGWPSLMHGDYPAGPEMADMSVRFIILYFSIIYILSIIFVLGWGFLRLSRRITGANRKRVLYLAAAFLLFASAGILDVALTSDIIVFARIFMFLSAVCLYKGLAVKDEDREPPVAAPA
jgi:hypothetical protein